MSFESPAPGMTICRDTPANWREFERLKELASGPPPQRKSRRRSPGCKPGELLKAREDRENQWIRKMSCFLPGHEPDKFA
jgi:hypothetical protein